MKFIENLNELIDYIENNLFNDFDNDKLAQILNTNADTLVRLFPIIFNISLNEYIKSRKLTLAPKMLENDSVINVAFACGYTSADSFSRAFKKFHGVLPSKIKGAKLNAVKPLKINFANDVEILEYTITTLPLQKFYGFKKDCKISNITNVAQKMWQEIDDKMFNTGIVKYDNPITPKSVAYFVATTVQNEHLVEVIVPKSKWLKVTIENKKSKSNVSSMASEVYKNIKQILNQTLANTFDIEIYHEKTIDLYFAIK